MDNVSAVVVYYADDQGTTSLYIRYQQYREKDPSILDFDLDLPHFPPQRQVLRLVVEDST